ncbi:Protein T15D6.4 [Aphelenchoides avenae]|nr:Protein T15D6.4 [Aphelenchus avenae]
MRPDAALQSVLGRNASVFMVVRGWALRILVVSACLGMCTFSIFSLLELKPSQRYVREAQMLAKAAQKAAASTSRRPLQTPSTTPLEEEDQEYSQVIESVPYERQPNSFCVIYDFWNATEEYKFGEHVTLVLHATPEFVTYITEQVNTWDGGISVALFIPSPKHAPEIGEDAAAPNFYLKAVLAVLSKLETARASGKVGLHLFFDKAGFDKCPTLYLPTDTTDISIEEADMQYFTQVSKIYPINAARNIARIGSKTKLFLSGDIENIFCVNYEPRIYPLAKKLILDDKQQAVLIHRRFEIDLHSPMPRNKAELQKLYKKGKAVQFHKKFFAAGHKIPHMATWFKAKENAQHASVSFLNEVRKMCLPGLRVSVSVSKTETLGGSGLGLGLGLGLEIQIGLGLGHVKRPK